MLLFRHSSWMNGMFFAWTNGKREIISRRKAIASLAIIPQINIEKAAGPICETITSKRRAFMSRSLKRGRAGQIAHMLARFVTKCVPVIAGRFALRAQADANARMKWIPAIGRKAMTNPSYKARLTSSIRNDQR